MKKCKGCCRLPKWQFDILKKQIITDLFCKESTVIKENLTTDLQMDFF